MKTHSLTGIGRLKAFRVRAHGHRRAWQRLAIVLTVCCLALAFLGPVWAGDGALDTSFNPGLGVSKIPIIREQVNWTTSGYANGNSLICGYFTSITDSNGTHSVNSIAKLTDFNGTVDTNFNNGTYWTISGEVRGVYLSNPAAAPNSAQDIIIWGTFSLTDKSTSKTYYNLARLTWNTTDNAYVVDTTFPQIFSLVDNGAGTMFSGVNAVTVMGTYLSSYVLVGGYNMQVQGDTTHAYHLIRLNNNFTYDSTYGPTNAYTQAKSLPGGYVTGIGLNASGQPRIFGTLPVSDGSGNWTGHFHWWEAFTTDTVTFQKSLGDQTTSGSNYGPIDGPIFNIAQTSSGQYIIVGVFKNVYGNALNRVAQLNSTLSGLDNTNNFNSNIANLGGADHGVQQILIDANGKPVLAGGFTGFNGTAYGHIVRLNYDSTNGYGTVDTSFNYSSSSPTAGAGDRIFKLYSLDTSSTQSYFQILGAFQSYNNVGRSCIATLNTTDGSLYTGTYASPFAAVSTTGGTVYAMDTVYVSSGQYGQNYIVIGGDFTGVNGKYRQNLAYLNLDGSLATGYPVTVFEGQVNAIRGLDDGSVLVAGNFLQAQGYGCTSLARLNPDATFDATFRPTVTKGSGLSAGLRMVDTENSGNIDIGGNFATVYNSSHSPVSRTAFAVLDTNGYDTGYNAQFNIPTSSKIKVNTGGSFGNGSYGMIGYYQNTSNSSDAGFACVLNSSGVQTNLITFNGEALCGTSLSDGRIVVGGNFTQVVSPSSAGRNYIAALTSSFTLDTNSFTGTGTGANGPIYALHAEGDNDQGNILIGGNFTAYGGVSIKNVARLYRNGTLDPSFNPGTGPNNPVYSIKWTDLASSGLNTGRALLGGAFTSYNGTSRPGIAQVFATFGVNSVPEYLLLLGN